MREQDRCWACLAPNDCRPRQKCQVLSDAAMPARFKLTHSAADGEKNTFPGTCARQALAHAEPSLGACKVRSALRNRASGICRHLKALFCMTASRLLPCKSWREETTAPTVFEAVDANVLHSEQSETSGSLGETRKSPVFILPGLRLWLEFPF